MKTHFGAGAKFALLNAVCLAGLMGSPAIAQEAADPAADEIVVTGFRASLASSTNAKRESTNFSDSIFAEDIGQFPDLNIAESLNRVPGVNIEREVNGEGLRIAIRGLGTNFVKVLLNGNQIAVASSGAFDNQGANRELDLDLFPTELFNRLDVNKSPTASTVEGGLSGTVNLRMSRPFDNPGTHITYTAQSSYASLGETWSPRGALIGSWTDSSERFGILGGISVFNNKLTTVGYETIGSTNINMSDIECGSGPIPPATANPCNDGGGNGFTIPDVTPVGSAQWTGVPDGTPVTAALLEQLNPGMTAEQLGEALLPRLGRPANFEGQRDRLAGVVSLQFRPFDMVELYLDIMGAKADRDINRRDIMAEVRGGGNNIIPMNWVVDENNVLESGRLVNGNFFLEPRPYNEHIEFVNINPGARLTLPHDVTVDLQFNMSRSHMFRSQPTIGLISPRNAGYYIDYDNTTGPFPTFTSNFDVNDPNSDWRYTRLNLFNEKRITTTEGAHLDFTWGDEQNNIRFGGAYDNASRRFIGRFNDGPWEDYTCRGGGDPDGAGPLPRPACEGGPGSAIPVDELPNYLRPGFGDYVDIDYDAFFEDSNYWEFFRTAPNNGGSATGAQPGLVDEDTVALYVEANGESDWRGHFVRYNAGIRYIHTDQFLSSLGPADPVTGVREFTDSTTADYDAYLPSLNVVAEAFDNVTMRFSASRTLTRQNPQAMFPNTTFSDPGAQFATQGNPTLTPYLSTNIDFGGEWYTGGEGYVGVTLFTKEIQGFTQTGVRTVPFSELGINYDDLSDTQQTALNSRGGLSAPIQVSTQVNANGVLTLNGYEITWVQPLDIITEGLGFSVNYTRVNQSGEGAGAPPNATNVPRFTYNAVAYYERGPFSGRFSYNFQDESVQTTFSGPADGFPVQPNSHGYRYNEARGQLDAAFRFTLEALPTTPQLTLDLINITDEPRRSYQGFENATNTYYDAGRGVLVGVRGSF